MANTAGPFGMRPVRHRNGAPFNSGGNLYYLPTTAGTSYIGDPVVLGGSYNTTPYYNYPAGTLPTVTSIGGSTAVTAANVVGSIVAFFPEQATSPIYNTTGTARGVYVADDPDLEFEMVDDGLVAATANFYSSTAGTGVVNNNACINNSTFSGNAYTGVSGVTLATGSFAGTATLPLHVLGLAIQPNNALSPSAIWRVIINTHAYRNSAITGV